MLFEYLLLLSFVKLALLSGGCPDNCEICAGFLCRSCNPGFYGFLCTRTCVNCEGDPCHEYKTCVFGCKVGWFGTYCDQACVGCPGDRCKLNGDCQDTCLPSDCTPPCDKSCFKEEHILTGESCGSDCGSEDQGSQDDGLSGDTIALIALVAVFMVIGCIMCYLKLQSKNSDRVAVTSDTSERSVQAGQYSLTGGNYYMDSSVIMALPFTSLIDPSSVEDNTPVMSFRNTATDTPPSYEQCTAPPPSYEVLFKTTNPPS